MFDGKWQGEMAPGRQKNMQDFVVSNFKCILHVASYINFLKTELPIGDIYSKTNLRE